MRLTSKSVTGLFSLFFNAPSEVRDPMRNFNAKFLKDALTHAKTIPSFLIITNLLVGKTMFCASAADNSGFPV